MVLFMILRAKMDGQHLPDGVQILQFFSENMLSQKITNVKLNFDFILHSHCHQPPHNLWVGTMVPWLFEGSSGSSPHCF